MEDNADIVYENNNIPEEQKQDIRAFVAELFKVIVSDYIGSINSWLNQQEIDVVN